MLFALFYVLICTGAFFALKHMHCSIGRRDININQFLGYLALSLVPVVNVILLIVVVWLVLEIAGPKIIIFKAKK